jgi:hypothetical protein
MFECDINWPTLAFRGNRRKWVTSSPTLTDASVVRTGCCAIAPHPPSAWGARPGGPCRFSARLDDYLMTSDVLHGLVYDDEKTHRRCPCGERDAVSFAAHRREPPRAVWRGSSRRRSTRNMTTAGVAVPVCPPPLQGGFRALISPISRRPRWVAPPPATPVGGGASFTKGSLETVTSVHLLPHLGHLVIGEVSPGGVQGNFESLVEPTWPCCRGGGSGGLLASGSTCFRRIATSPFFLSEGAAR